MELSENQPLSSKVETGEDTQEKPPYGTHQAPPPWPIPVVGGHHEVQQQPDGLLHIDLVGGGQPLVELVVDGRQDSLQPRHIDLGVVVQCVEPVVTIGFDHVPDIHQVNCEEEGPIDQSVQQTLSTVSELPLTVASLLHKPEFAGSPVGRQSDHVEVLSSCGHKT